MTSSPSRLAAALLLIVAVFIVLSNTVGDGNLFGGIAFFVWVFALLALIVLGVRTLVQR